VKHALRQFSQETAPAQPRQAPLTTSTSTTVIQLSSVSGGGSARSAGKPATNSNATPGRRGSRGGDLVLGGGLTLLLLVACLTWEVLSHGNEVPHALQTDHRAFVPALH
jgi:hypothetical protein